MKSLKYAFSTVLFLAFFSTAYAQFTLSAQLRPRMEFRKGYRIPQDFSSKPAFFISQRTRLNFNYVHDIIEMYVSLQDVRTWGDELQMSDIAGLSLHQAWTKIKITEGLYIKPGRQELIYDEHRLLGNVDWVQQARSHDAILLLYQKNKWRFDAVGAFNQLRENVFSTNYISNNYKALVFLRGEKSFQSAILSVTGIADAFEKNDTIHDLAWRYTYGAYFKFSKKNISLVLSAYGQSGQLQSGADIAAFMVNAKLGYKIKSFSMAAGLDFLSGNNTKNRRFQAFNTLYATNHKFYGFMDYYLNVPSDSRGGGLQDYFINFNYQISEKTMVKLYYHQFLTANKVYDSRARELSKNLGGEFDLAFVYDVKSYLSLQAGASVYMPTSSTEIIKGGDKDKVSGWAWLMLNVSPELFKSKKD